MNWKLALLTLALIASHAVAAHAAVDCKSPESIKGLVKNPPAMTSDEYEAILNAHSCCDIDQANDRAAQLAGFADETALSEEHVPEMGKRGEREVLDLREATRSDVQRLQ